MRSVGRTCPFCQAVIKPGHSVMLCSVCGVVHHQDCWNENGGCTTPGCAGVPHASSTKSPGAAAQKPPLRPARRASPMRWILVSVGVLFLLVVLVLALLIVTGQTAAPFIYTLF
jgi:hypothetical protein